MFKLAPATFKREITVKVPVDGGFESQTMTVTYNVIPMDKSSEMLAQGGEGLIDFVNKITKRVDDIAGDDGKQLEWNDEVRDQLLNVPYVWAAILDGYKLAMGEARVKN